MTASNHFGWFHKLAAGGLPEPPTPPLAVTGRGATLTARTRPVPPPRYFNVELQHQGLAMYVGGAANSEHQIAEIIENRWPEWRIVAVREES